MTQQNQDQTDQDNDDEGMPRINPDWIMHQYNDNRDVFQKHTGSLWRQHRVYDLLCYNLTKLYNEDVTAKEAAEYYGVEYETMLKFLKRNGINRMKDVFKFVFSHALRQRDKVKQQGEDYDGLNYYMNDYKSTFPKLTEHLNINRFSARPFDVESAAKLLARQYNDPQQAWQVYQESSGLNGLTNFDIYVYWNNRSFVERRKGDALDRQDDNMLRVYEMLKNDYDHDKIKEYVEDVLASDLGVDLED